MSQQSTLRSLIPGGLALALSAGVASADLTPEWVARLPVGSSLSAGLQGMVVDAAGVSFVTGTTGSSSNTDVVTAAFAPDGSLLWSQVFDGPAQWHDQARGIALGPGGIVWVTGNTPGPGTYANVLLLAYDAATGAHLHTTQYSNGPGLSEHGASVAVDAQGNVYVGGGTVGDGGDALTLKFDPSGQLVWQRVWDGPASAPYSQDSVQKVLLDPSGAPVVMIHGVMGSLHPDYVVIKYAPVNGLTTWETNWGVNGGDFANDMKIDSAGDVYVTGTGIDFIDKYSTIKLRGSDGQLLWQAYDSAAVDNAGRALALDGQGGVYITGSVDPDGDHSNFNDNMHTVKRDATSGAFVWSHLYGANCIGCYDVSADVIADSAGHVFVAGSTSSPPYSADTITFVLDAGTGAETVRGLVSGAPLESLTPHFLRFDGAYNLLDGGETYHANTGAVGIHLFRYASLADVADLICMPGIAGVMGCPCSNPASTSGRGCDNSSATGGATIAADGVPSLSADTLVFRATGEKPSALSLLLQGGSALPQGTLYGQGVRCSAGPFERLFRRNASGGAVALPDSALGDSSVSARSAALGRQIAPGESRWYLIYYRDPIVMGSCPSANTFNTGPTLEVDWTP